MQELPATAPIMTYPRPRLRRQGFTSFVREILETIVLVVAIYSLVRLATASFMVVGPSMEPNFYTGQFLLVSRVNYLLSNPTRGDIIVFHYPRDPQEDYIKRVIGVPGDTVDIHDQHVFVNGTELNEPYINEPCRTCSTGTWTLGPDQFFVMGDNRNHSSDSRFFGTVDRQFIVGEALIRYWPPENWGIVNRIADPEPVGK